MANVLLMIPFGAMLDSSCSPAVIVSSFMYEFSFQGGNAVVATSVVEVK